MSNEPQHNEDEDLEQEIHVEFEPYEERLAELGISLDAFEEALARSIDEHAEAIEAAESEEDIPSFENMPVHIGNQTFRVTELADVSITSDFDEEEEDEFDDDDFDDEEDFDESE